MNYLEGRLNGSSGGRAQVSKVISPDPIVLRPSKKRRFKATGVATVVMKKRD